MASHRHAHQSQLNYFQQPPVRGQLEPLTADGYSRTGWRWLQCTDTPNELRVLLPPRTALFYVNLLKVETAELAKDEHASWDRIMQIRHLKDRMIRKCQRLARGSVPHDRNAPHSMFLTIHAPPDFRLKEMERWFRDQGAEVANMATTESHTRPYCCEKCGPPTHTVPSAPATTHTTSKRKESSTATAVRTVESSRRATASSSRYAVPVSSSQKKRSKTKAQPVPVSPRARQTERRASSSQRSSLTSPPKPTPQRARSRSVSPYHGLRAESPRPDGVLSPEPIPIPYRPSRDSIRERTTTPTPPPFVDSPEPLDDHPIEQEFPEPQVFSHPQVFPEPQTFPEPQVEPPKPSSPGSTLVDVPQEHVPFPTTGQLETIHEHEWIEEPESSSRPNLPRRRSSLKKSGSRLSLISQKSVTWAMDHAWEDQISKYTKAVDDADVLAHQLEDARQVYHDHVADMRKLCRHVILASEKVRLESESLHRQEEIIRSQEGKLMECCNRLQHMELQYREKVLSILDETKRVVQLCDRKREPNA